nr:MAG TPA: hypothetical protein [Caudoviricetes sp.]
MKSDLYHTTSKQYKNYLLEYRHSFLFYKNFLTCLSNKKTHFIKEVSSFYF